MTSQPAHARLDMNTYNSPPPLFAPRAASGVVADLTYEGGRDYSRGTNFTCIATAGNGEIVTGSRDGRLRLYRSKDSLSRASTNLPSFG